MKHWNKTLAKCNIKLSILSFCNENINTEIIWISSENEFVKFFDVKTHISLQSMERNNQVKDDFAKICI